MDLRFTPEEIAFRDEVRAFMRAALPEPIRRKMVEARRLEKQDIVAWQRILNARGWAVPHWPVAWGGTGWSPVKQYIFSEELQQAPAPDPLQFGVTMVGPVIIAFGSETQKRRYLPPIANLDEWWCQGFSEPGAGSDLASLKTTARRDGDHYIVNGQKTWTTTAQYADWIFCLVRTDPAAKKQQGISFLLIDMKTPGITVRPIQTIDGGHEVNEVFFDEVRVPVENRVGEENRGWDYAKFLLGNERTGIARVGTSKARIRRLKEIAAMDIDREELLMKLGAARSEARAAWRLIDIEVAPNAATFSFALNRQKLRSVRQREGRYLLRSNLCGQDPAQLWQFYIQLVEIEATFKTMKDDLNLRPIYHQCEQRIEAHIFVAFLAYCLHVTLRARLKPLAPGLTPRAVLDKLAAVQMLDVHFPTTDGRTLVMSRYTEFNADQKLLVKLLKLDLPTRAAAAALAGRQADA